MMSGMALNVIDLNPLKPSDLFFSSPSCQIPCAFNIVPGITSYTDANQILSSTIRDGIFEPDGYFSFQHNGIPLHVKVYPADPREGRYVRSIEISSFSQGAVISLGDLINLGYTPHMVFRDQVTAAPNGVKILISFEDSDQIAAELLPQNVLDAQSPIDTLTLSTKEDAFWIFMDIAAIRLYREPISWIGYATVDQYLALPKTC
jgi:hypothetical protein